MDISRLPPGARAALVAATRTTAGALASSALTGPQAVAAVTGASAGLVSKWMSSEHPEAPTIEAAALLEAASGLPVYAAAFAALTGNRVVPIVDDDEPTSGFDPHAFAARAFAAASTLHAIMADGRVTPAEARAALADLGALTATMADLGRDLTRLAEG